MQESLPEIHHGRELIGYGISGFVYEFGPNTVLKIFHLPDNCEFSKKEKIRSMEIETRIYKRLGEHPRICKFLYPVKSGFALERCGINLRSHLRQKKARPDQAMRWSIQTAQGLAFIHSRNILQSDIGCHNLLLDHQEDLKFCDFAGSSIDGEPPEAISGVRYRPCLGDDKTTITTEIFALGSTLYEIWMSKTPYEEECDEIVEYRYQKQQFPNLDGLPIADVILKCWTGRYSGAMEVVNELLILQTGSSKPKKDEAKTFIIMCALLLLITLHFRRISQR
jgi:serine/threonine protein kinase